MCETSNPDLNDIVELYKARICAVLDGMSFDEVQALVKELEDRLLEPE